MAEGSAEILIENKVEGPQLKIEIELSKAELLKQMPPNQDSPTVATRWIYDQIEKNIPDGEIKTAFSLAYSELKEKTKQGVDRLEPVTFVSGSDKYAFRGVLRKSDGSAVLGHDEANLSKLSGNVFNYGIDAPGSEENIMPRVLWEMHAFPTVFGLVNRGEDITEIFVYRNESFVLPNNEGGDKVTLVKMSTREKKQITTDEAVKNKYPTLRDIFVGQLEVRYV